MEDRIKLRCDVCGEAENCDFYCELTIDNVIDIEKLDELLCPLTGDEAGWYEVKVCERIQELEAEIVRLKTQMLPNEYEQTAIEAMDEGKAIDLRIMKGK